MRVKGQVRVDADAGRREELGDLTVEARPCVLGVGWFRHARMQRTSGHTQVTPRGPQQRARGRRPRRTNGARAPGPRAAHASLHFSH